MVSASVPHTKPQQAAATVQIAEVLTLFVVLLAAIAAAIGLFIPTVYRDPATITPAMRGQDLVTLLVVPVLAVTLFAVRRGSSRASLVWIGLLGYMLYTYLGASVAYYFNPIFLLYVALLSLSAFALVFAVIGLNGGTLAAKFDNAMPRWPTIAFMLFIVLMLGAMELAENIQYLNTGELPRIITQTGGVTYYVYALDLGFIVPLAALAAIGVWRRAVWGYVIASYMFIKSISMGLALLAMNLANALANQPTDSMVGFYAVLALGGLLLGAWFLGYCRD
jgi:hypothetical protein